MDNDVFIDSGVIVTTSAPIIKTNASSQYSIKSPQTVIDGDLHIAGNLHVTGEITAGGDVIAGNGSVSLLSHIHGNGKDGADTTGPK